MLEYLNNPIPALDSLTIAELKTIQDQLDTAKATVKRQDETFQALMLRRFGETAKAAYVAAKKETGTVHAPASNTLNITIDTPKKVEWDQDKLPAIFNSMKGEDAKHFAKVVYAVPEDKYKAATPAIQKMLQAARTVRPGKIKISLTNVELVEDEAA